MMRAASEADNQSAVSGTRSALIRHRGQFPKYIWQRGALYSTKKSRKDVSMGRSPIIKKRGKGNLLNANKHDD